MSKTTARWILALLGINLYQAAWWVAPGVAFAITGLVAGVGIITGLGYLIIDALGE